MMISAKAASAMSADAQIRRNKPAIAYLNTLIIDASDEGNNEIKVAIKDLPPGTLKKSLWKQLVDLGYSMVYSTYGEIHIKW